jgi:hypothetical protein
MREIEAIEEEVNENWRSYKKGGRCSAPAFLLTFIPCRTSQ